MSIGKAILYLIATLLALMVVSAIVSVVFAIIALVWLLVRVIAAAVVLGALGYGAYKLSSLVSGWRSDEESVESAGMSLEGGYSSRRGHSAKRQQDPVDRLKERYADGELSESEFERRLERELDDGDSIDRELQRERI